IEEHVAGQRKLRGIRVAIGPAHVTGGDAQEEHALEPEPASEERRRARVVRLDAATRHDSARAAIERVLEQELELANLVSGFGAARHVVALHPELDAEQ